MGFTASLIVPVASWLVELAIRGTEDDFTGVREGVITWELTQTAGPPERQQLAWSVMPIEWHFERYEPGTRADLAYCVSDDEKCDPRFPDHPLTRVRRWLRRQERVFRTIRQDAGSAKGKAEAGFGESEKLAIGLQPAPVTPMSPEEVVRELGSQVASDELLAAAWAKLGVPRQALPNRQKMYRDQRNTAAKEIFDQLQEQTALLAQIRKNADELLKSLNPETATVYLVRERGSPWHYTLREGQDVLLAVFATRALVEDFIACKKLECDPVETTLRDLFASFAELRSRQISALELNRCPRCAEARPLIQFDRIPNEAELARLYAAYTAGRPVLAEKSLRKALEEPEPAKREAMLRNILEHIDPAVPSVLLEAIRLATASGNSQLAEQYKSTLARYAPERLGNAAAQ
jgi:hypothetical protein